MIKTIIEWLYKRLARKPSDYKEMQEYYITRIKFMKEDYEEQIKRIKEEKLRHPENGKELDEWLAREEKLHNEIIKLIHEKRDIEEKAIFLQGELDRIKRKHRSMYE